MNVGNLTFSCVPSTQQHTYSVLSQHFIFFILWALVALPSLGNFPHVFWRLILSFIVHIINLYECFLLLIMYPSCAFLCFRGIHSTFLCYVDYVSHLRLSTTHSFAQFTINKHHFIALYCTLSIAANTANTTLYYLGLVCPHPQ